MSDRIIKLLSQEIALGLTPTTMGNVGLVRIKNSSPTTAYAILVRENGTITGSMTLYAGESVFIRKNTYETIESTADNSDVRIVAVGYGD